MAVVTGVLRTLYAYSLMTKTENRRRLDGDPTFAASAAFVRQTLIQ